MDMPTGENCWKKNSGTQWAWTSNLWIPSLPPSLMSYIGRYVEWKIFKNVTHWCRTLKSGFLFNIEGFANKTQLLFTTFILKLCILLVSLSFVSHINSWNPFLKKKNYYKFKTYWPDSVFFNLNFSQEIFILFFAKLSTVLLMVHYNIWSTYMYPVHCIVRTHRFCVQYLYFHLSYIQ